MKGGKTEEINREAEDYYNLKDLPGLKTRQVLSKRNIIWTREAQSVFAA